MRRPKWNGHEHAATVLGCFTKYFDIVPPDENVAMIAGMLTRRTLMSIFLAQYLWFEAKHS